MVENPQSAEPYQVPRVEDPTETAGPWGLWPTIGFSLVIAVAYTAVQVMVAIGFAIVTLIAVKDLDIDTFAANLTTNGFFFSVAICAAAPVTLGLIVLFAAARKRITISEYLGLGRPAWAVVGGWCIVQLLYVVCSDGLTYLIGRPVVPSSMIEVYRTAYFVPLLWFAVMIVAPATEEAFFRGFLFRGVERSRLGPAGAVILTALAWAAMHGQYDLYGMAMIFVGGLLLGFARLRAGALCVPLAMHMLQNLLATAEVVFILGRTAGAG